MSPIDRIEAIASTRHIEAVGAVKGWMTFKDESKFTEKSK